MRRRVHSASPRTVWDALRVTRRRVLALVAAVALGVGLFSGGDGADARWLVILAFSWLLLLASIWPAMPDEADPPARAAVRVAAVLGSALAVIALQLLRTQITRGRAIQERVGVDPVTGDLIVNPRAVAAELQAGRGDIRDRTGAVLAESLHASDGERRVYPALAAAELTGYFSPLLYGTNALEAAYDLELSGRDGPGELDRLLANLTGQPPAGLTLDLSLDIRLQSLAHELLADRPGAVILLDIRTGATLAMASSPSYNPNPLSVSTIALRDPARAYWQTLNADLNAPLVLRPTSARYTPGSIFKLITAAAAIEEGIAAPDTVFEDNGALEVNGRVIPELNRPDDREFWTLQDAIGWSLNVVMAQVGLQLGPERLTRAARAWGFDTAVPFDLPTVEGQIASGPDFLQDPVALAETAFGQGQLLATPLQMVLVAAGLANGGDVMRPRLVDRMTTKTGRTVWEARESVWRRPVRPETADEVAKMMRWAVEFGGLGAAFVPGQVTGGKTGTAELDEGQQPHAWFIGFGGATDPEYAVAVLVEHAGGGGANALPIGRAMLTAAIG